MGERFGVILLQCLAEDAAAFEVDATRDDRDSISQAAFKTQVVTVLGEAADIISF